MGDELHDASAPQSPRPVQTRAPGFSITNSPDTVVDPARPSKGPHAPGPARSSEMGESARITERYADPIEIGRGGMGRVYKVKDQDLNRDIAMKVLAEIGSPTGVERFVAEAQISGQLEHPSLLPIHDFGINAEGEAFFTMRYVPHHRTLHEIITSLKFSDQAAHQTYTMERRVQIIQRVCDALTYAHERGVIHRDIKPSNIIVGDTGEVYLADWGLAQLVDAAPDDPTENSSEAGGQVSGTPLYMSPEQFLAEEKLTPKSDVYSLCAVAYEFLCLRHYLGDVETASFPMLLDATLFGDRKDADSHFDSQNGRVPRQIGRILRKGLQTDRESAIESSQELHDLLQHWSEGKAPIVCPGTFIQHCLGRLSRAIDRKPVLAPTLTLLTVAGLVGAVMLAGASLFGIL